MQASALFASTAMVCGLCFFAVSPGFAQTATANASTGGSYAKACHN